MDLSAASREVAATTLGLTHAVASVAVALHHFHSQLHHRPLPQQLAAASVQSQMANNVRSGLGKLWPAGRMQLMRSIYVACKCCHCL